MDEQRFDQLTRSLARGNSRRGVLKGLVGVLGGALGLGASSTAEARGRNPNGTPCASPRDCATGLCVDGICCDGACIGACEACNVAGSEGICSPVIGAPVGNRGPCPGDGGPCNGVCDGITTTSCAGYPGNETVCGDATCAEGMSTGGVCSGNGLCIQSTSNCGLYDCAPDGTGCLTACTSDAECIGAAHCDNGACVGDHPLGTICTDPDQCASGRCVDGVCCDTPCDGECQTCGTDGFCADNEDDSGCDGGVCCHGDCIALSAEANCLGCGDVCVNGETCCEAGCALLGDDTNCGACGDACVNGQTCCDGTCTALDTDENCGFCGGACLTVNGELCCDGDCIQLGLPANCGACGDVCDSGQICCNYECLFLGTVDHCGTCGGFCDNGEGCCGGDCTPLGTEAHCLNCDDVCDSGETCCATGCIDSNAIGGCGDGGCPDNYSCIYGTCFLEERSGAVCPEASFGVSTECGINLCNVPTFTCGSLCANSGECEDGYFCVDHFGCGKVCIEGYTPPT